MEIIRKASLNQVDSLHKICVEAYSKNFHDHRETGGLEWYLKKEFSLERLSGDLFNPIISYYFIENEGEIIGFTKINLASNFPDLPNEEVIELEKIYILPDKKGYGVG